MKCSRNRSQRKKNPRRQQPKREFFRHSRLREKRFDSPTRFVSLTARFSRKSRIAQSFPFQTTEARRGFSPFFEKGECERTAVTNRRLSGENREDASSRSPCSSVGRARPW